MQFKGNDSISAFFSSVLEKMMIEGKYAIEVDTKVRGQDLNFVIILSTINGVPTMDIPDEEDNGTIDMYKSGTVH